MKRIHILTIILLLVSICLLPTRVATAQLKATLEGHTDIVWSVAFRPNGVMLASASWDGTVRLWNVDTGRLQRILTGHANDILSVVFSPDGQTLVSASWDGNIRIWNPNNGKLRKTFLGHAGGVASVAFSPDGKTLASGGADATVRLWNTRTWARKAVLKGHIDFVDVVAFSPDGNMLVSASADRTIRLWNPNNGKYIETLTGHTNAIQHMVFSPDGRMLASGSADETIRLWNPRNGKMIKTLTGYTDWVNPMAFSPDGKILLTGGRGISVWDTETGEYKAPLNTDIWHTVSVVFSPNGERVVVGSGDHKIYVFDFTHYFPDVPLVNTAFDMNNTSDPIPPPDVIQRYFELDSFYQQWINVGGLPVVASSKVNPYAVKEAAWLIWQMIGHRPDILKVLAENRERIYLLAIDEAYSDLPEYESIDYPLIFLHAFDRDIVISDPSPGMLAAEENLLLPDSNYPHFLIHEFAHKIHAGLNLLGTTFDNRLKVAYDAAMAKGLWHGYYAAANKDEYWAEGTNTWFHSTQTNAVNTRADLKTYDPGLARLLTEVYGDNNWLYSPPATRTHLPHLQGFNPQNAITFDEPLPWGIGIQGLVKQLKDPNSDGDGKWTDVELHDPSQLQNLLASTTIGDDTIFFFVNPTESDISFHFFDDAGKENLVYHAAGQFSYTLPTRVGTIWLIKGPTGKDIAVFRVEGETGRVLIGNPVVSEDVNSDGIVNILDMVLISANFGRTGQTPADVNGDGIVNIVDLVKVAGEMGAGAAAPTAHPQTLEILTAANVQHWLRQAQHANLTDATSQRGILMLQQLLAALIPKETSLLPNYPNPFNPETWIPYQLAEPADVTLRIYSVDGRLIRTLALGHQPVGMYHSKSRAAYWDGKNEVGEFVASGVYFYTLTAGKFTATRKMLIRK